MVYVLAGNFGEYIRYCNNRNIQPHQVELYISDYFSILAVERNSKIVTYGTWRERQGAFKIIEHQTARGVEIEHIQGD